MTKSHREGPFGEGRLYGESVLQCKTSFRIPHDVGQKLAPGVRDRQWAISVCNTTFCYAAR